MAVPSDAIDIVRQRRVEARAKRAASPKLRVPKVLEVATEQREARPEWNVCAFKGNLGQLHVSQRLDASMMSRAESAREIGEEYF